MANNFDYDSIIDDLAKNDPEFLKQSPEIQDSIVMSLAQERGQIPNSQKVLTSATSEKKGFLPKAIRAFTPQYQSEMEDLPSIAMKAMGVSDKPLTNPVGFAAPVLGQNPISKTVETVSDLGQKFGLINPEQNINNLLQPKTKWGQTMGDMFQQMQVAVPLGIGATRLAGAGVKGVGNLINSVRTSPIKKNISSLEEAIAKYGQESEALSYKASQEIPVKLEKQIMDVNKQYGELADQADSKLTKQDVHGIIDDMVDKLKLRNREFLTSEEKWLLDEAKNRLPKLKETSVSKILDPSGNPVTTVKEMGAEKMGFHDWKALVKHMRQNLSPKSHILTQFYESADPIISKSLPDVVKANSLRAPLYQASKNMKILKQPRFKEVATGDLSKISAQEIGDLTKAEKSIGTDYVGQAGRLGEKLQTAKKGLSESQQALEKAKNRKLAAATSIGTLGGLGIISRGLSGLKKMITGERV